MARLCKRLLLRLAQSDTHIRRQKALAGNLLQLLCRDTLELQLPAPNSQVSVQVVNLSVDYLGHWQLRFHRHGLPSLHLQLAAQLG